MPEHDPLCPRYGDSIDPDECWWCPVIARARADERERIAEDRDYGWQEGYDAAIDRFNMARREDAIRADAIRADERDRIARAIEEASERQQDDGFLYLQRAARIARGGGAGD